MSVTKPSVLSAKCRETTQLLSLQLDEDLTTRQWWAMTLHMVACVPCRRFRRQLHLITELLKEAGPAMELDGDAVAGLSPETRERLRVVLRRAGGGGDGERRKDEG
jgi:hypothetical protein